MCITGGNLNLQKMCKAGENLNLQKYVYCRVKFKPAKILQDDTEHNKEICITILKSACTLITESTLNLPVCLTE